MRRRGRRLSRRWLTLALTTDPSPDPNPHPHAWLMLTHKPRVACATPTARPAGRTGHTWSLHLLKTTRGLLPPASLQATRGPWPRAWRHLPPTLTLTRRRRRGR